MFILKFITKLILVPVWFMLLTIWIPVHLAVSIFGAFHGLGKLFFGGLAILAITLGMWQNAMLFSVLVAVTFIIVLVATLFEALLEEAKTCVGSWLFS